MAKHLNRTRDGGLAHVPALGPRCVTEVGLLDRASRGAGDTLGAAEFAAEVRGIRQVVPVQVGRGGAQARPPGVVDGDGVVHT